MIFEILLATNNQGKIERYRKIVQQIDSKVILHTLNGLGIETVEVNENGTLSENAKKKAISYLGKTKIPVLANDAGFYIKGKGLVKNPKRIALKSKESGLKKQEVYDSIIEYWREIARKQGGEIDAAWIDSFVLVMPNGKIYTEKAKREVILTDKVFGKSHLQFPMRALYISKTTNKPALLHTEKEEFLEINPIREALRKLIKKAKLNL